MQSLVRFLVFFAAVAAGVAGFYLWKSASPPAVSVATPLRPQLASLDREFTSLVAAVVPSVVSINAISAEAVDPRASMLRRLLNLEPDAASKNQLGAGAILTDDGYIITNWHVVSQAGAIEVGLSDGRSLPATLVGADPPTDLAVLKIAAGALHPLDFSDSDQAQVGQMVFAVGNPYGLSETVTRGIISGRGRRTSTEAVNDFLQTDAPINPGNSGGPLVDLNGRLIGLNNSIIDGSPGISFAIPSNTVRRVYEAIRKNGRVVRPWFGITMVAPTPEIAAQLGLDMTAGALVATVTADSPAARAGIRPGDLITSYNGRPVADGIDLRNRIFDTEPGSEVPVTIRRAHRDLDLRAKIERMPGE